jgi:chemotaxis protein MotB
MDRANASRRTLIAGGMNEDKVMRLVGLASAVPYDKTDPFNPVNRRISIIVMNRRTEDAILRDGAPEASELSPETPASVAAPLDVASPQSAAVARH